MKICPDCRSPVNSMMFLDKNLHPEYHCERCARAVTPLKAAAPAAETREPVLNGRR